MKKLVFLLTLLTVVGSAAARPITPHQASVRARELAPRFCHSMADVQPLQLKSEAKGITQRGYVADPAYYMFNIGDEQGFLVLSGDDEMPAVIGYSDKGALPTDYDNLPPALRFILDCYSEYVEDVRDGNAKAPARAHGTSPGTPVVGPLLTSKWDQGKPYNIYCPTSGSKATYTGCVATALAQILYYWKWPESGTGTISYTNDFRTEKVNFSESHYEWSKMKNTYSATDASKDSGKAVAKLMYDCGVATRMDYGTGGSGTVGEWLLQVLYKNFRYRASTIDYRRRNYCSTTEEFYGYIKADLEKNRPIFCGAASSSGSGADASGHAFVLDGYDTADYVSVNWGWSGDGNGWFDIDVMDVYSYKFNVDQDVILGIEPDKTGTDTQPSQLRAFLLTRPEANTSSIGLGASFNVHVGQWGNFYPFGLGFKVGIGLFAADGSFLRIISSTTPREYLNSDGYSHLYFPDYADLSCTLPTTLGDGKYQVRIVFLQDGFSEWKLPYMDGGEEYNAICVDVKSGQAEFYPYGSLNVKVAADGYATFFSGEYAYYLPDGLTAYVITGYSGGKLTSKQIADGDKGEFIPKGVPVLLKAAKAGAATYTLQNSTETKTYTGANLLHGSNVTTTTTAPGSNLYYKLAYGPASAGLGDVFGWYWGASMGAPFVIEANKAWLALPKTSAVRMLSGLQIDGEPLQAEETDEQDDTPLYDLQGRPLGTPAKNGIYIKNGKKFLQK